MNKLFSRGRFWLLVLVVGLIGPAVGSAQGVEEATVIDLRNEESRERTVVALYEKSRERRQRAVAEARARNWVIRGVSAEGRFFELVGLDPDGRPLYLTTHNVNAAISTAADQVRNVAPYNVSGDGLVVGVWDGGAVRDDHQEFLSPARVIVQDGAGNSNHATHVAGTIGAEGVNSTALGMAPEVIIHSYDWTDAEAEMVADAAGEASDASLVNVSNHSYGLITGWASGDWSGLLDGPHWFGDWPAREDEGFGQYSSRARDWDSICHAAPYFLPFKSAGNDRNDSAPGNGTTFAYWDGGWQTKTYDANSDPLSDGFDNGGFDTIGTRGNAKNIMTVGAVNDAVSGGFRSTGSATMSSFSGWGPTDDGRIKPDIVANGVGLISPTAGSISAYSSFTGTSMSSPNAAGSALLLIEHYRNLFGGSNMRAATLKGLIIHTADDIGRPGPDYVNGWGLMNTKAAADHISAHDDEPGAFFLVEDSLSDGETITYPFTWDGSSPIRATLSWTDLPGTAKTDLDDPTSVLVNDLDLRIEDPSGDEYQPFVLDPANPATNATVGDNVRDNVEQVLIGTPAQTGTYTVVVTHKGVLSGSDQAFSVLLSGTTEMAQDHVISGSVREQDGSGVPGVVITGLPGNPTTDANGFFERMVADGWSGTLTPKGGDYAYYPESIELTAVSEDRPGRNFTAVPASTESATYTGGDIPTDVSFTSLPGTSGQPGQLTVTIPAGAEIVGVDVQYEMSAANSAWMSEQRSWLRCISQGGTGEAAMAVGIGDSSGTYSYERTGLAIANGVNGGGNIQFELHAGRTWGGAGINTTYNKVDNSTWTVTVHFQEDLALYDLDYTAGAGGSVTGDLSQSVLAGGSGSEVVASPDPGAAFREWSDGLATAARQDVSVDEDISVTARFESEGGVPISWFDGHGIAPEAGEDWADLDSRYNPAKGMTLKDEYLALTDPNDPSDIFMILRLTADDPPEIIFSPESPDRFYTLESSTTLQAGDWTEVPGAIGVRGTTAPLVGLDGDTIFYRVKVSDSPAD